MKIAVPYCIALLFITACVNRNKQSPPVDMQQVEQALLEQNKQVHSSEKQHVSAFIEEQGWDMQETETGLWHQTLVEGNGQIHPKSENVVIYSYELTLLDGNPVAKSDPDNPKDIKIGYSDVERGVQEGLQLMVVGDSARFVIPSHLAHGFTGDLDNIPFDAALIGYVKLLDIRP